MDDYPESYVAEARPLIILSGLGDDTQHDTLPASPSFRNGHKVRVDAPLVVGDRADALLAGFRRRDVLEGQVKQGVQSGLPHGQRCTIKALGRVYRQCFLYVTGELTVIVIYISSSQS